MKIYIFQLITKHVKNVNDFKNMLSILLKYLKRFKSKFKE